MSESPARPLVVTVFNQKGGIGKTTTTVNLAVALAALGHRVALIDLDSQSNATSSLGVAAAPASGAYRLLTTTDGLGAAMVPTPFPGVWLCAATDELVGVDIELAMTEHPQTVLRDRIREAPPDVDFVLIDCPPALGMLPVNALVASDLAILPVSPEPLAREGLLKAWRHIHRIRANLNQSLHIFGVLLTMVDKLHVHREFAATVRAEFGGRVLPVVIPRDPVILAAAAREMPVVVFDPESPAAKAHLELARLLLAARRREAAGGARAAMPDLPEWLAADQFDPAALTGVLLRWREEVTRDQPPLPEPPADAAEPRDTPWQLPTAGERRRAAPPLWLGVAAGLAVGFAVGVNWPLLREFLARFVP